MARYSPQMFNKNLPVYVRKSFSGNGRMWLPGQRFDWQHYAISVQRVRQLFRSSYLKHEEPDTINKIEPEVEPVVEAHNEVIEGDFTLSHAGGAYWNIIASDGTKFNQKGLKREEAEALLDELNS